MSLDVLSCGSWSAMIPNAIELPQAQIALFELQVPETLQLYWSLCCSYVFQCPMDLKGAFDAQWFEPRRFEITQSVIWFGQVETCHIQAPFWCRVIISTVKLTMHASSGPMQAKLMENTTEEGCGSVSMWSTPPLPPPPPGIPLFAGLPHVNRNLGRGTPQSLAKSLFLLWLLQEAKLAWSDYKGGQPLSIWYWICRKKDRRRNQRKNCKNEKIHQCLVYPFKAKMSFLQRFRSFFFRTLVPFGEGWPKEASYAALCAEWRSMPLSRWEKSLKILFLKPSVFLLGDWFDCTSNAGRLLQVLAILRRHRMKILCPKDPEFFIVLALNCQKGQHPPSAGGTEINLPNLGWVRIKPQSLQRFLFVSKDLKSYHYIAHHWTDFD